MKKTLILILALIGILGASTIFYNTYQKNATLQPKPSGMSSEQSAGNNSNNHSSEQSSEIASNDSTDPDTIPAIDFTVYTRDETAINLSDFYGKPIVVNFWATWCGPCKSELPAFENLYNKYSNDITFMMVNLTDGAQETVDGVTSFINQNNYTFPVYFDTAMDAAMTYSVYSIPATLFIDADGNIVASHLGAMSEDILQSYIDTILN